MAYESFDTFQEALEAYVKWLKGDGPPLWFRFPHCKDWLQVNTRSGINEGGCVYAIKVDPKRVPNRGRLILTKSGNLLAQRWYSDRDPIAPKLPQGAEPVTVWLDFDAPFPTPRDLAGINPSQ